MATGEIELQVEEVTVQSRAAVLPLQVNAEEDAGEETRLRFRYLDLRREKMQARIRLRGQVIQAIREGMVGQGFQEFQTPILTASSRSEEHTSELQSLMRISYAVFCLKNKKTTQ